MTWNQIKERPVAWCLTIAGVKYRYFARCVGGPGDALMDGLVLNTDLSYVDVEAITNVGPVVSSIDDVGGIARQDPISVRMLARDAYAYGPSVEAYLGSGPRRVQPYHELRRTTPSGASRKAQLMSSLPHSLAITDVIVDRDVTSWLDPIEETALIHIGQEAFWATGAAGDGTSGDPWRFTDCTRAVARTQVQGHTVSEARGEFPWVTSEAVFWKGRRALIHCAEIHPDKTVGEWKEYWRGFIDSPPELSGDGLGLRVNIAPMTIALSWTLGVSKSPVVPGWHYLTKGIASELDAKVFWAAGELYQSPATNFNGFTGEFEVSGYIALNDMFDPSLPNNNTRHGQLQSSGNPPPAYPPENISSITAIGGLGNNAKVVFNGSLISPLFLAMNNELVPWVKNPNLTEHYPLSLMDGDEGDEELVPWPGRLIETINHQQLWNKTIGPIASWADPLALSPPTYDRWCYLSVRGTNATVLRARKSINATGNAEVVLPLEGDAICWGGFICRSFEGGLEEHRKWTGPTSVGNVIPQQSFFCNANPDDDHSALEVVGAPDWWYQPGEKYIGPFEQNVYTGFGGSIQVVRVEGEGTAVEVPITGATEVFDPDDGTSSIGYIFSIDESAAENKRVRPIAQVSGESNFTVTQISQSRDVSVTKFLVQLLMSGQGRGTNGDNDTMGCGLNFGQAEVDEESFEGISVANSLQNQKWEITHGKAVIDQIKGLLIASSAQIAQVWDPLYGTWRLKLIDLTPASLLSSSLDITDYDTLAPVATVTDGRVMRSYELEVNIPGPGVEGESVKVKFVDGAAGNAAGGDQGETLNLTLPGVTIGTSAQDQSTALLDIISDLRNRLGFERVRWNVRIPADASPTLGIGDTVTLTSVYAADLNPTIPVVNRPCRVYGVNRDLEENTQELRLVSYPGYMSGYVPSMKVREVIDATSVYVEDTVFSKTDVLDISFFEDGANIYCYPIGDFASRVSTTCVVSNVGPGGFNMITTPIAHGLSDGDIITHADYASVVGTDVQYYAYIASSAEVLGVDSAPYLIS